MNRDDAPLTLSDFLETFEKLKLGLCLTETEETWEGISSSLRDVEKLCLAGACEYSVELLASIRSVHRNITNAINSERTRLSGVALDVLTALASGLNSDFELLLPLFLPTLLQLCGRTNKVVMSRAKACVLSIIEATQLPAILPFLVHSVKDKSPTVRLVVTEGALACLKCFNPPDLEKEARSRDIESIIRAAVRDASAEVRRVGKDMFQSYKELLPHRVDRFTAPLTPTVRKYLQLGVTIGRGSQPKVAHSSGKPSSASISKPNPAPKNMPLKPRVVSSVIPGPTRPTPFSSTMSHKSDALPSAPVRLPQAPAGYGEKTTSRASRQQGPLATMTRPSVPSTSAVAGPQRVPIKAPAPSTARPLPVQSTVLPDGKDSKGGLTKTKRITHPVAVLASSSVQLSSSRVVRSTRPLSASKPLSPETNTVAPAHTSRAKDITRPTLSQLARAKPLIARSTKPVERLKIHKIHQPANVVPAKTTHIRKARTTKACGTDADKRIRSITPSACPLPPSPEPRLARGSESPQHSELSSDSELIVKDSGDDTIKKPEAVYIESTNSLTLPQADVIQDSFTATPTGFDNAIPTVSLSCKTPISALLSSIQQGFDMTPCSPLSPAQHYMHQPNSPHGPTTFRLGAVPQQNTFVATLQ